VAELVGFSDYLPLWRRSGSGVNRFFRLSPSLARVRWRS